MIYNISNENNGYINHGNINCYISIGNIIGYISNWNTNGYINYGNLNDYINYWNLIGDLLGVNQALLPKSNREAYILERNIREGQFRQSESGIRLTKSLLRYFETATLDTPLKGRSKTLVAYLLGDRVSGLLGLQNSLDEKVLFQPYKYFFKIQNTINLRNDSYAAALKQFREVQKSVI